MPESGLIQLGVLSENQQLREENLRLQAENFRLRLALALLQFKPQKRLGGRPRKYTAEDDARFFQKVELLRVKLGITERGALAKVCRRVNDDLPRSQKIPRKDLEKFIKTLQNRQSALRKSVTRQGGNFPETP